MVLPDGDDGPVPDSWAIGAEVEPDKLSREFALARKIESNKNRALGEVAELGRGFLGSFFRNLGVVR